MLEISCHRPSKCDIPVCLSSANPDYNNINWELFIEPRKHKDKSRDIKQQESMTRTCHNYRPQKLYNFVDSCLYGLQNLEENVTEIELFSEKTDPPHHFVLHTSSIWFKFDLF